MIKEWKCIGRYFNRNDEVSSDSVFINDAEMPLIVLRGNAADALIRDNNEVYFRTNSTPVSRLIYELDDMKSDNCDLPSKIMFKARIYDYGRINGSVEILKNIFIRFELLNGVFVPCIAKSVNHNDTYFYLNDITDGEWFNVEITWIDRKVIVRINDNSVLTAETENIIKTGSNEIVNCDEDAKFCMDIKDLQFWKLVDSDFEHPRVKIVEYEKNNCTKLGVLAHPGIDYIPVDDDSIFRIQLSSMTAGTYIPVSKLQISGCTFSRNEVISPYNECYKVYMDDVTGEEVKVHVYFSPKTDHSTNVIYNIAYYNTNINENDVLNIDTVLFQNGVNLCGRIIMWDSSDLTSSIYNSFKFKTVISTSLIRDSLKAYEGSYVYPDGFKVVVTTSTDKGSGGIFGGGFKNTVFESINSDNTETTQNVTFNYNDELYDVVLSSNAKRTDDSDASLYTPYRLFHEYSDLLTDISTEVVSQSINATTEERVPLIFTMDFGENTPLGIVEGFNFYTGCIDPDCGVTNSLKVELIDKSDNSVVKCYEYNDLDSRKTHYSFFNDLVYYNLKEYVENYDDSISGLIAPFKIVITSPSRGGYQDLVAFRFNNLAYVDCVTTWPSGTSYTSVTSEEVIFSGTYKGDVKEYHAIVAYENPSSRWSDNGVADWDPHRFVADEPLKLQRKLDNGTLYGSKANGGMCSTGDLSISITFIDPVPYDLIRDFNYNTGEHNSYGVTHRVDIYSFYSNPICTLSLYAPSLHYTMVYSLPDIFYTVRLIVKRPSHRNYPMICQMAFDNLDHVSGTDTSHTEGTAVFTDSDKREINADLKVNYNINADMYPNILFEMPSSSNPNPYYIFCGYMVFTTPYDNSGLTYDVIFNNEVSDILNYRIQLGCKEGHSASQIDAFESQLISRYDESELVVSSCSFTNSTPNENRPVYVDFVNSSIEDLMYYKMVITKGRGSSRNATLANGLFENLTYIGRRTQNYTSNITSVDIYFEDPNGNEIECTISYLSSRWSDNGAQDYAPCNFFARNAEQSWVLYKNSDAPSELASGNGSNLSFEILFKTRMPLKYINNLSFDNGRFSGNTVNVTVYSSTDLNTFTQIINKDLPSGNSYNFTI